MEGNYKTVKHPGSDELIEKRSRFVADVAPVTTEAEALAHLDAVRKAHPQANHHVYAYVPVSYTHLDVYKRQGYGINIKMKFGVVRRQSVVKIRHGNDPIVVVETRVGIQPDDAAVFYAFKKIVLARVNGIKLAHP